jgi:hypothetical protein
MTHCSDDELVLQYYGESPGAAAHLATCAACAARAGELAATLASIDEAVPERDERYGTEVWYRVRPHLQQQRSFFRSVGRALSGSPGEADKPRPTAFRWSLAAAATIALLATGYMVGRMSTPASTTVAPTRAQAEDSDPQLGRRVLLLTVADHLDRSDRVLTDIMNTPGADISAEQQWARDLIAANRLYRQDALDADESSVATVLDELERALLDIVHRPADAHAADLDQIRQRIDSAALLFKVRVMSNELRDRQFTADAPISGRSNTPIS